LRSRLFADLVRVTSGSTADADNEHPIAMIQSAFEYVVGDLCMRIKLCSILTVARTMLIRATIQDGTAYSLTVPSESPKLASAIVRATRKP
jgi:hypothetical protein